MKISLNWLRDFIDISKLPAQGSPEELKQPVVQAEKSDAGVDPATLAKVGAVLRAKFTGNNDDIGSTGDPAVDALLMAMGFRP